ncbi:hypothetical protein HXX76_003116 [Chlamydomonas incerta]|uniref:Uncharacterized protein n=1 Tax=Chlamydomonas incerta TaxID=51695 RepID=A0A835W8K3_CHLIN|nr:hypothetical protein HXX76_003116 [Chlamydomonas incerta]|eukprot:KAG2441494.1 hypothetical protein HXX76_003116 [Chlamydomonas incerta]
MLAAVTASVRRQLKEAAEAVVADLSRRFPPEAVLEALKLAYPQYWRGAMGLHGKRTPPTSDDVEAKLATIQRYFGVSKPAPSISGFARTGLSNGGAGAGPSTGGAGAGLSNRGAGAAPSTGGAGAGPSNGEDLPPLLDMAKLRAQKALFSTEAMEQAACVLDAAESGSVKLPKGPFVAFWQSLTRTEYQLDSYGEFMRLAKLAAAIVPGSVEAERAFSTMSYIKNKQRNRLQQQHLSLAVRMKVQQWFKVSDFPYAKALANWRDNALFHWEVHQAQGENWLSYSLPPEDCMVAAVAVATTATAPPAEVVAAVAAAEGAAGAAGAAPPPGGATGEGTQQQQDDPATDTAAAQELWAMYGAANQALQAAVLSKKLDKRVFLNNLMAAGPAWQPGGAAAAVLRIARVLKVEGLVAETAQPEPQQQAQAGAVAVPPQAAAAVAGGGTAGRQQEVVVLRTLVLEEQSLRCPSDIAQAEADELVRVWAEEWACMPDLYTVLQARAACNKQGVAWAGLSWGQRRTACELVLLYGEGAASWRPSPEAEAEARKSSSSPDFVTVSFLSRFMEMHGLRPKFCRKQNWDKGDWSNSPDALLSLPGQAAWNPRAVTKSATTSWVCANIVVPATRAYGMSYSDLFLSKEAQDKFLPPEPGLKGAVQRHYFCYPAADSTERMFASHAWATRFDDFVSALQVKHQTIDKVDSEFYNHRYWIDIYHKNQHQSVAVHDLSDNLRLAGKVALVVHPFPSPLALTRVWCLFEIMTAIQVSVPIKPFPSQAAYAGFQGMMGGNDWGGIAKSEITPELEAEMDRLDVSTAQATVAADKDMILGMIRDSMGVDSMNAQVRALFKSLLPDIAQYFTQQLTEHFQGYACFGGDGIVGVVSSGPGAGSGAGASSASSIRPRARPTRVADVRAGDWVVTAGGGISRVVLVTVDSVGPQGVEACELQPASSSSSDASSSSGNTGSSSIPRQQPLLVTADHPVLVGGVWRLPRDMAPVQVVGADHVPYGCVFNLELDPPASLDVSGVVLVSLGQDTSGEVRQGVDPASDALFGWGWRHNPDRSAYLRQQQARQEAEAEEDQKQKKRRRLGSNRRRVAAAALEEAGGVGVGAVGGGGSGGSGTGAGPGGGGSGGGSGAGPSGAGPSCTAAAAPPTGPGGGTHVRSGVGGQGHVEEESAEPPKKRRRRAG